MLQDCEQGHKNITSAKGDLPPCCSKKLRLLYQLQIQQQCSHPSTLGPDLYRQDSDKNFEIGKQDLDIKDYFAIIIPLQVKVDK